jgi:hypothetical protein
MSISQTIYDLCPKFERLKEATQRRDKFIRALKRGDKKKDRRLAHALAHCNAHQRCGLPFCPLCVRDLRRSYVLATVTCVEQIRSIAPKLPITAFSAIPAGKSYRAPAGKLRRLNFEKLHQATQRALQRLNFPVVFAGLDISLNEDSHRGSYPYWQIHLYGVVVGMSRKRVRRALEPLYPSHKRIPRPLKVSRCRDLPGTVSYSIKPYFSRRVSYIGKNKRRNTRRPLYLRAPELRELAHFLANYELKHRYTLIGVRRTETEIVLNSSGQKN